MDDPAGLVPETDQPADRPGPADVQVGGQPTAGFGHGLPGPPGGRGAKTRPLHGQRDLRAAPCARSGCLRRSVLHHACGSGHGRAAAADRHATGGDGHPSALRHRPGDIWHYTPQRHKNEYRDQEILAPFLLRDAKKYCFSPRESEVKRLRIRHARRITPAKYGNRPGTHRVQRPQTRPSQAYTVGAYGHAIRHALAAANKASRQTHDSEGLKIPF